MVRGALAGGAYYRMGLLGYSTMDRRYEFVTVGGTNANMMIYLGEPLSADHLPPSHEVIIEIAGEHVDRGKGRFRYELVDLDGYATLSARGIAIAVECLLGLGGRSAPKAGLYLPESILDAHAFAKRLQDLGVTIEEARRPELPI